MIYIFRSLLISYFISSDERLLEYDIDEVVFEEKTNFQKVQILHSKSLGNMLVLDDLQSKYVSWCFKVSMYDYFFFQIYPREMSFIRTR